jgi:uncharacterized membrane protein YgaE (UPF0421/DUF939 family)
MEKELHDWSRNNALLMGVEGALAVLITYLICVHASTLYHFPYPPIAGLWGAISAVFVLSDKKDELFKNALNRFVGTLVGAAVPCILAYIFGGYPLYAFPLAIFLATVIMALIGSRGAFRISGITVVVVFVIGGWHAHAISPWLNALTRLFESTIGIVIALIIDYAVYPIRKRFDLF